ncbi:hypothetical protein OIU78_025876 [Salix suchowensis]|nr:hypothetical protein OIU78_025876 [Salix suchowensis]
MMVFCAINGLYIWKKNYYTTLKTYSKCQNLTLHEVTCIYKTIIVPQYLNYSCFVVALLLIVN